MVDYGRSQFNYPSEIEQLMTDKHKFKEVITNYEVFSKDIRYPKRTKIHNLDLVVTKHTSFLKGSLHKYKNYRDQQEEHNWNDFTYSEIYGVIEDLRDISPILVEGRLTTLEFGFNISTNIKAKDLLARNILMFKQRDHNTDNQFKGKGQMYTFARGNYLFKIYDKALQYSLKDKNILRVELKYTKRAELKRLGISSLADLQDKNVLRRLFIDFIKKLSAFQIVSLESLETIPEKDKNTIHRYTSQKYWERFGNKKGIQKLSNSSKSYHTRAFSKLVHKYSLDKTKKEILSKVTKKFLHLINH